MSKKNKSLDDFVENIMTLLVEKKAEKMVVYRPNDQSLTDYIILLTAKNRIHCQSLQAEVNHWCKDIPSFEDIEYFWPLQLSGKAEGGWLVLDLNSIVIHIMIEEIRDFYDLDALFQERSKVVQY